MHTSTVHFTLGEPPVTGAGLGVSEGELNAALSGPIPAIVFDAPGSERIEALLAGLPETDFERENLQSLLTSDGEPENWRVGEAIAESFLTVNRGCQFPWPDGRDERKRGSSLPGADLVGFCGEGAAVRFVFGEVKTSSENAHPPGLVYGRHGLKQQLEDLREAERIREGLVKYLAHRATGAAWLSIFRSASAAYLRDTCDVRVFGILVRDVCPHEADLRARVARLARECPAAMTIELVAIYLPEERIATLGNQVAASRREGGAR